MATKNAVNNIPKNPKDHFRDFKGFAPTNTYETFLRVDPSQAASHVLKEYKGKVVTLEWYPISGLGVAMSTRKLFAVPKNDILIDNIFAGVHTDTIEITFPPKDKIRGYVIQRIVDRGQSVSEIDRKWPNYID